MIHEDLPSWLNPEAWLDVSKNASKQDVEIALSSKEPGLKEFVLLVSPAASGSLELMAQKARAATRRHFGKTISLYVPLYISNECSGGCAYCGFASDRDQPRKRLTKEELEDEIKVLKEKGFEDVLILTGERTPDSGFEYLVDCVKIAAESFHNVSVESFAMPTEEYKRLSDAGCTGVTLYQETYNSVLYDELHRWGPKKDYLFRLNAPDRVLEADFRTVGLGALLGLGDPLYDAISLFQHVQHLRKKFWRSGVMVSFPRICGQAGDYQPKHNVNDKQLAQLIFAFRICMPDVPLVLSTRESVAFRDGMAGIGVSRMSVASKTTVGGYFSEVNEDEGQFYVSDTRDVDEFREALKKKELEPVFKSWDSIFQKDN